MTTISAAPAVRRLTPAKPATSATPAPRPALRAQAAQPGPDPTRQLLGIGGALGGAFGGAKLGGWVATLLTRGTQGFGGLHVMLGLIGVGLVAGGLLGRWLGVKAADLGK